MSLVFQSYENPGRKCTYDHFYDGVGATYRVNGCDGVGQLRMDNGQKSNPNPPFPNE
jgi:hypothetical protein